MRKDMFLGLCVTGPLDGVMRTCATDTMRTPVRRIPAGSYRNSDPVDLSPVETFEYQHVRGLVMDDRRIDFWVPLGMKGSDAILHIVQEYAEAKRDARYTGFPNAHS